MKPVVLLLHGFGGNRSELASLRHYLRLQGFTCFSPKLPGHDADGRIAVGYSHADFTSAVVRQYEALEKRYTRIVVIGFSMGGLLALKIASEHRPLSVVTINTPIYLWNIAALLYWIIDDFRSCSLRQSRRIIMSILRQRPTVNLEYLKLLLKTIPVLHRVIAPCFIVQSLHDETAHYRSAAILSKLLSNAVYRKVQYFRHSWHQIGESPDAAAMNRAVSGFVKEQLL